MELYANLTACIMRLHQLLHSAAPREITAIIELGFASCDYCINLHSAAPRAINSVIALYAVRLAYITLSVNHIISDYGVGIWEPNKGKRRYDHTISEWNIEVYSKNQSLVDRSMFVACRNLGIICIFLKSHNTMIFLPTSSSPSIYDLGVEASPMQVKNFKSFPGNYISLVFMLL